MEKIKQAPKTNPILLQKWEKLSFMHWRVDKEIINKHIPKDLSLDLYDNVAYIGVIPFMMKNVRPRWGFSVPFISNFPEFNIRTYVKKGNIKGVFFITLDAQSIITRIYASNFFHLPYRYSRGFVVEKNGLFSWNSNRLYKGYELKGSCEGYGKFRYAEKKSLEEFFFERYYLFTSSGDQIKMGRIHHDKWMIKKATPRIIKNEFLESYHLGIKQPHNPAFCHISNGVEVEAWPLENVY